MPRAGRIQPRGAPVQNLPLSILQPCVDKIRPAFERRQRQLQFPQPEFQRFRQRFCRERGSDVRAEVYFETWIRAAKARLRGAYEAMNKKEKPL